MDKVEDMDEVQVQLWKGIEQKTFTESLCRKWSPACKKRKLAPVGDDREDELFMDVSGEVRAVPTGDSDEASNVAVTAAKKVWNDARNSVLVAWKQVYSQARKTITYKRVRKEAQACVDWYVAIYKRATKKNVEWQYDQLQKQAKKAHRIATNKKKNRGVQITVVVIVLLVVVEIGNTVTTGLMSRLIRIGSIDNTFGTAIFIFGNLVMAVMVGIVAWKPLLQTM